MDCVTAREALSAALDGEPVPAGEARLVRGHLAGCDGCAQWHRDATELDRALRIGPAAEPGPDISEQVLAAARLPRAYRWPGPARAAVVLVGIVQLGVGLLSLFGPMGMRMALHGMAPEPHMDHEQAAFNLAFGIAMLVIGIDIRAARFQLPVLASFVAVLTVASGFDLADGNVGWARLASHLPIVVGVLLAAVLSRAPLPLSDPGRPESLGTDLGLNRVVGRGRRLAPHWRSARPRTDERQNPPPAAYREVA
jgi:predicted anti-sigma-YlaC factor YlaD